MGRPARRGEGHAQPERLHLRPASQTLPESLKVWHNGHLVLDSVANTGIPASPTADGTYAAKKAYPYLTYGSLVTVIGPVGG